MMKIFDEMKRKISTARGRGASPLDSPSFYHHIDAHAHTFNCLANCGLFVCVMLWDFFLQFCPLFLNLRLIFALLIMFYVLKCCAFKYSCVTCPLKRVNVFGYPVFSTECENNSLGNAISVTHLLCVFWRNYTFKALCGSLCWICY